MIVSWETNTLCYVNACDKECSALVRSFLKFNSEIHSGGVSRGLKCLEKAWGPRMPGMGLFQGGDNPVISQPR